MSQHYVKLYNDKKTREKYYKEVGRVVARVISNPVTLNQHKVLQEEDNFTIVEDRDTGIRLFVKKDEHQNIEIIKKLGDWMTKTNQWLYIAPLGIIRSHGIIIYDYYENDIHHMLTYYKQDPTFVISVVQRVILTLYQLKKIGITHNDLHLRNILYNENVSDDPVIITTDVGDYSFPGGYEIVIGDFGMSFEGRDWNRILEFYKMYFPLLYYSNSDVREIVDPNYIDIWRFLQTLLIVLDRSPDFQIMADVLRSSLAIAENRLVSRPLKKETIENYYIQLVELLYLELSRVSFCQSNEYCFVNWILITVIIVNQVIGIYFNQVNMIS